MRNKEKKKGYKGMLYSTPAVVVLVVLVILLIHPVWSMLARYASVTDELEEKQEVKQQLESRHLELSERINRLESGQDIERELRRKFNAVREGEEMVIIIEDTASEFPDNDEEAVDPWWTSLLFWREN